MEDVKIKLSALWVARMLTGFLGDVIRFFEPGIIEGLIIGDINGMQMSSELLFSMAIMMEIPIIMVVLSLLLKEKPNRNANIIVAVFLLILDGVGLIVATSPYVYVVVGVGLMFNILTIYYAWNWPLNEEVSINKT